MKLSDLKRMAQLLPPDVAHRDQAMVENILRQHGLEPGEIYQELEMSSRFAETHRDVSSSNAAVSLHSHTFFEILYCCSSCGAEYLVGADRYRLQKGDVIMVPPGISHRPLLPPEMPVPYTRYVLWISPEFLNTLKQQFPEEQMYRQTDIYLLRTAETKWEFIGDVFRRGVEEAENRAPGWEAMVLANSTKLLVQLGRAVLERTASPLKAEKPELLDKAMAYLEAHLSEKITLADVAHHCWVSQSTISQTFRNKMGVSFYRCVTQRRLIAAKAMILENMPLENVGRAVGFTDYSTFYRAFKQEYGISPRQYLKKQETGM